MKLVEEERRQHELLREELIMQGLRNVPTAVTHKEQVETTTSSILLLLSKHHPLSRGCWRGHVRGRVSDLYCESQRMGVSCVC